MLHRLVIGTAIIGAAAATSPRAQEATNRPRLTFRSAVDIVTIQASVRDARGRVVRGLMATDFEVRDNGELRPILSLRADLRSPVSLAVLVDTSGSMRLEPKTAMAREAFDSILSQLRSGQDEVAVFTFDSALHERRAFTRDLEKIRGELSEVEAFGSTSLYDAIAETARRLAGRSATHKAIIVLTDGIDTSSRLTAAEVSGLASSIDVPVYIVATVPTVDREAMTEAAGGAPASASGDLRDLAEWTGGRFIVTTTFAETAMAASSVVGELRQQYVLAIEAADARGWRRLEVRVKHSAASVKARSGYFAG